MQSCQPLRFRRSTPLFAVNFKTPIGVNKTPLFFPLTQLLDLGLLKKKRLKYSVLKPGDLYCVETLKCLVFNTAVASVWNTVIASV